MKHTFIAKSNSPLKIGEPSELALTGINQLSSGKVVKQTILQRLEQIYNLKPSRYLGTVLRLLTCRYTKSWEIDAGVARLPFDVYVSELYIEQERKAKLILTQQEWEDYFNNLVKIHDGLGLSKQFKNHSLSNKKRVTKEWIYSRNWGGFWSFRVKRDDKGEERRRELSREGKEKESQSYRTDTMVCIYKMHPATKLLQLAVIGRHDEMYVDINPSRLAYYMHINKKEK